MLREFLEEKITQRKQDRKTGKQMEKRLHAECLGTRRYEQNQVIFHPALFLTSEGLSFFCFLQFLLTNQATQTAMLQHTILESKRRRKGGFKTLSRHPTFNCHLAFRLLFAALHCVLGRIIQSGFGDGEGMPSCIPLQLNSPLSI